MSTILYNNETNKILARFDTRYIVDGEPQPVYPPIYELEVVENETPTFNPVTQKLFTTWEPDIVLGQYQNVFSIVDKTEYEMAMDDWDSSGHVLRIIAPQQLIMDDIGIKMYGWFQLNALPIVKKGDYVRLYCNEILPEHQAVVNALQGVITVDNKPTES